MLNPYLARKLKDKKSNKFGLVSEKLAMKDLGAKQVPGSGCIEGFKSDGISKIYRYENKSTQAKSFSVKRSVLKKIQQEAFGFGQVPIVSFSFVNESGKSLPDSDYIMMRRVDFKELNEKVYGDNY